MSVDRRTFIASSAAAAASWAALGSSRLLFAGEEKAEKPLHVLVMGGTGFLGPHCVNFLLERGHKVTLFNRGKTNPHLFPDLPKLIGDRKDDVKALEGQKFDAVLDTNGYFPKYVRVPLEALKDNVGRYLFVSTCSVYAKMGEVPLDENSEVLEITPERTEEVTAAGWDPLESTCRHASLSIL